MATPSLFFAIKFFDGVVKVSVAGTWVAGDVSEAFLSAVNWLWIDSYSCSKLTICRSSLFVLEDIVLCMKLLPVVLLSPPTLLVSVGVNLGDSVLSLRLFCGEKKP